MRNLVIGYGEIGQAIEDNLKTSGKLKVWHRDKRPGFVQHKNIEVLHICYPYSKEFIDITENYMRQYDPRLVMVYSTVPIGTCDALGSTVVHSPVEGRHPDLTESVRRGMRWMGSKHKKALAVAQNLWFDANSTINIVPVGSSQATELLKLTSTTLYGINLAFADYRARIASEIGVDYELFKNWDSDYNDMYKSLGYGAKFQRYVLDPPSGKIGGHCVVPNAELLYEQYPDELVNIVKEMK